METTIPLTEPEQHALEVIMTATRKPTKHKDRGRRVKVTIQFPVVLYNELMAWGQRRGELKIGQSIGLIVYDRMRHVNLVENFNNELVGQQARTIYEQRKKLQAFAQKIKHYQTENGEEERRNFEKRMADASQ